MQIVVAENVKKGITLAKEELYKRVDNKTVLFLSGGKTPEPLYTQLAEEKVIKPAAVALVDERYGKPMHKNSNEGMIQKTGLLDYFDSRKIPFYPILKPQTAIVETAAMYDETVRNLFFHFPKSIGILGIGADGHTAGIAPKRADFSNPLFTPEQKHLFVSSFHDKTGYFGERVTLTFAGISLLDFIIIFMFGKEKMQALQNALKQGDQEEIPARLYQTRELAKKTLIITDQKI